MFLMPIEDVFRRNQARRTLLTGCITRGQVAPGDELEVVGFGTRTTVTVAAIEAHRRGLAEAHEGMNVGLSMHGVAADAAVRGQVLAAPGSIREHTRFAADITLLSAEQGATTLHTGSRLQFHIGTAVVTGTITLTGSADALHPLHTGPATITLAHPVPLEPAQPFAFRHATRATGSATVTHLPT
jgi:elongation factor Tu